MTGIKKVGIQIGIWVGIIKMKTRLQKISYVLLATLIELVLYIFIHECGHMIVMLFAGASITEFSILTAHVSFVGGNFDILTDLWLNVNGILLPFFIAMLYAFFYNKNRGKFYKIFSFLFVLMPLATLLLWVFVPIIYVMQGTAPVGDDIANFLLVSTNSFHPLYVSLVALILMIGMIFLIIKKGVFKEYIFTMRN